MGFGPTMACGGRWQAGRCVFARGHCGPRGHGRLFHRVPHERLWSLRAWLVRAVADAVLVPQMRRGMTLPFGFADGAWEAPARAWCVVGMWALRATWAPGALRRARPLTAVALACMLHGPPSGGRYLFVGAMAKSGGDVVLFCCVVGLGWGVALVLASTACDDASCGRSGALLLEWEGCFWRALWCTPRPPLGFRGRPRGWFTWGTPVVVADSLGTVSVASLGDDLVWFYGSVGHGQRSFGQRSFGYDLAWFGQGWPRLASPCPKGVRRRPVHLREFPCQRGCVLVPPVIYGFEVGRRSVAA